MNSYLINPNSIFMGWIYTRAFILSGGFYTPTTENKMNANIKGITQKEVWVGEVPAKYSLTNICMFKQGDYEKGSEWEEEVEREWERRRQKESKRETKQEGVLR